MAAHTLKSSSAVVGASHLSQLAGELERALRAGAEEQAAKLVEPIEMEHRKVCSALRHELSRPTQEAA